MKSADWSRLHVLAKLIGMTDTPVDPLGTALLPVVIHDLNNATQLLTTLNTLLGMPGGERFLHERADDLSSVGEEVFDLGWLLAALASSAGDELLLDRRHESGLEVMSMCVRNAVRRHGRDLAKVEGELPRISNEHGAGWEAAWALGLFLWSAAQEAQGPVSWTWSRSEEHWLFEAEHSPTSLEDSQRLLELKVPGAQLVSLEGSLQLRLPAQWLEPR